MKTEDHAWRSLQDHASAQLRPGFADRVIRFSRGPDAETWNKLRAHAASRLQSGFAQRVLRAARQFPGSVPSLGHQFALGAVTVVVCLAAVVFVHSRSTRLEEQRALMRWEQLAADAQDDSGQ